MDVCVSAKIVYIPNVIMDLIISIVFILIVFVSWDGKNES